MSVSLPLGAEIKEQTDFLDDLLPGGLQAVSGAWTPSTHVAGSVGL